MDLRSLFLLLGIAAGLPLHAARAQATEPSLGGGVGAIIVTATTMELSFGTSGTGQGRVVAIAVAGPGGMPVPLAATNGQFYTAAPAYGQGSALGQGYTVYNGTGHSVTVTGLQPDTYYYVTNAEYNTDGPTIMYNLRGTSMSTATRSAPPVIAPLPVELTAFTGALDARNMATLHWATASERNTAYFALERSADGVTFTEADRLLAAGSSSQPLTYQWPDPQRRLVPTYYRLRQVDRDGAVHYSAVVPLSPSLPMAQSIEVYPNPSAGRPVQLLLQGYDGEKLTLRLTDALGRPVLAQALAPADAHYLTPLTLPQGLPSGTYFLTLAGSGSPLQKRIVVSN